jgi:hypothetical protein
LYVSFQAIKLISHYFWSFFGRSGT